MEDNRKSKKKYKEELNVIDKALELTKDNKEITDVKLDKNEELEVTRLVTKEDLDEIRDENLGFTKQQKFNFETNNYEFEDIIRKNKNKEEKITKKKVSKDKIVVIKEKYPVKLILLLYTIILVLIGFILFHFITFNHDKVNIKEVEVVKKSDSNYIFLGDSITDFYDLDKYYDDLPVVNSGVNGNSTTDILDDMYKRVYRYNPTKVFILIGTNDITKDRSTNQIVNNISKIVKRIKKNRPSTKIYIESIYPVSKADDSKIKKDMVKNRTNKQIKEINKKLKEKTKELNVNYINMYDKLTDKDDNLKLEYTTDGLHMSDKGYDVITEEIMKYIDK